MFKSAATIVITTILAIIFVSFLLSFPLMLLWNGCLVPAIPVLNQVSWLQMWGISILIGCLFKTTVTSN